MSGRSNRLVSELRNLLGGLTGADLAEADPRASFLDLGFDSLVLTQASQSIQKHFGVKITFRQIMNDLASMESLAGFLDQKLPPDPVAAPEPAPAAASVARPPSLDMPQVQVAAPAAPTPAAAPAVAVPLAAAPPTVGSGCVERVVNLQLQLMAAQLEVLKRTSATAQPGATSTLPTPLNQPAPIPVPEARRTRPVVKAVKGVGEDAKRFGPFKGIEKGAGGGLTPRQEKALANLVKRYNQRTAGSKRMAQDHRAHFCDPRAAGNFRQLWKEMVYPIVCARSLGSRIWDIDGNAYVDVTMGFGANYLGHSPDYVIRALADQVQRGVEIGPQSPLAGENARLICELTGMERTTFCNTGSEAVMAALRVARTVTGRDKVVFFSGDYHGVFDEVLAKPALVDELSGAMPIAPGIPHLANVIVLEYGNPASLEAIQAQAQDIAAVLVEPVQARHPDLQPREFLHALRRFTEQNGIALIFDEVITGFRVAPGGAQEYFGVRADLATYGKVVGGGMPIGVLAGTAKFMDALDGGQWRYGDDSSPEVGVTFFAGTFVRHPLAMAAANASLKHLKACGPALQEAVNRRTCRLADEVNAMFRARQLPMRLQPFSAIFYYDFHPDLHHAGLLFYYLRDRGVHIWEGRVCHLSTAHSDADVSFVVNAFNESVQEMQEAGFLPGGRDADEILRQPVTAALDSGPKKYGEEKEFPLTEAQTEMWLAAEMNPDASGTQNGSNVIHLHGDLDAGVLGQAIEATVKRHEALRCTFKADGSAVIASTDIKLEFPVHDLTGLRPEERELRVREILEQDGRRIFNLVTGPLFSFQLIKLSAQEHLLVFTVQMIVCDGWSYNSVLEDVSEVYSARVQGREPSLRPATPMREYVSWQCQARDTAEAKECEAYWLSQYQTVPTPVDLPSFRPRPPMRTFAGDRQTLRLRAETYQAIKQAAKKLGATPFALLLSAYQVWLNKLSGADDVVIGIPLAGQGGSGLESLVGQCVHTLPLRFKLAPAEPFAALLRKTCDQVIDAQEHWNYGFGALIQRLDLPRDPSRVPLVSVTFNLDLPLNKVRFAGCTQEIAAGPRFYFQYDLGFNLVDEGSTLLVECDYNSTLFDAESVRGWLGHFQTLLERIMADPAQPVKKLGLLSPEEQRQLLVEWNNTQREVPSGATVHGLVSAQAALTPEAVAAECDGQRLTYGELERRSNQLANHLRTLGVGPEVLVGLCLRRSLDMLVGLLGVLKAGGAYVPIDPDLPTERMAPMIDDPALTVLLTHGKFLPVLPATKSRLVCLDEEHEIFLNESIALPAAPTGPQNLAYVIYTSGSTGKPKGVEITHGAVVNLLESMKCQPGLKANDVVLALTTLSFDIAVLELFLPLTVGARVVIAGREVAVDPVRLGESIKRSAVTVMQATPTAWRMLLNAGWAGHRDLKVLCGGEPMAPDLAERLLQCCGELWNMYGPTETTVWSATRRLEPGDPVTMGRPVANTRIHVVDDELQPVPVGVTGELLIGGAGLARGYRNDSELTNGKFIRDPFSREPGARLYRTGDLARYRAGGELEYVGRRDFQTKLRGYRIELGEVESAILSYPEIGGAAAVVREDSPGQPRLVAYVVSNQHSANHAKSSNGNGLSSQLRQFLRRKLPEYMVPSTFVFLEALPLTAQGKIDRLALPMPPVDRRADSDGYVGPRNPVEDKLSRIWEETLKVSRISVRDNFFDLGGQSLLAVSLFGKIEREFGQRLPLATLFRAPTIEQLASALSDATKAGDWACLVPIQPKGTRKPLFLVHGAGGNVLLYRALAQHLAPDYPLYGLQSLGLDGQSAPLVTIEEMAIEYLRELKAVQPHGPYFLGGYCLGGTVAYEMAQILHAQGEVVQMVAMLDTYNFIRALKGSFTAFMLEKFRFHLGNFLRLRPRDMMNYVAEKARVARDGELANLLTSMPGSTTQQGVSRALSGIEASVQAKNDYAADHYQPRPYPGRLTLFKPEVNYKFYPDPKMGWGDLALGGLDIVELPVNPHAMLVEPYVRLLAAELKARMDGLVAAPSAADGTGRSRDMTAEVLAGN